ncbi:hypothetical protein G6F57_021367 [Rhizopus arrhizus]|nr:hypothetical protein G6F35_018597 [Rhizopus arrhizus]KAG1387613.1 hypothetical protein G6F59_016321 [Rhizopus arrhizus]KAG1434917.1 hypothetical protein G6F57_021367 [Rhizopus arrhizus]
MPRTSRLARLNGPRSIDTRRPLLSRFTRARMPAQYSPPAGLAHGVPSMFLPVRQPASLASTSSAPTSTIMSSSLIAQ